MNFSPEEALFLVEKNRLALRNGNLRLTTEKAYELLLNENCSVEQYQAFCCIIESGCVISRHDETNGNSMIKQVLKQQRKRKLSDTKIDPLEILSKRMKLDKTTIDFPHCIGHAFIHLQIPPTDLLPPNVNITFKMCQKNQFRITSDRRAFIFGNDETPADYPKTFPSGIDARSWSEFKEEIKTMNLKNERLRSTAAPKHSMLNFIAPEEISALETLGQKLNFKKSNGVVLYDVLNPNNQHHKYLKHRLFVTNARDAQMKIGEICDMYDVVPLRFVVNDSGLMSFYSLNPFITPAAAKRASKSRSVKPFYCKKN